MRNPNVLLIVMDAARADHLSCYGYERPTTPHIDCLAAEGTLYETAISAAVWTVPSHASLFTGLHPSAHGLRGRNLKLREDVPTLASLLAAHGYRTAGFTANSLVGRATGLSRGFDRLIDVRDLLQNDNGNGWPARLTNAIYRRLYYGPRPHSETWYDNGAWRINFEIKRWIRQHLSKEGQQPFFIFANYLEPHLRYQPPRRFRERFLTPEQNRRWREVNQNAWKYVIGEVVMRDEDWDILVRLYDAEIAYLDMRLGQLTDFLRTQGILDDTVLIITSDHGENLGDHNLMDHQYCAYDTLLHVPLVIRYPRVFPAGKRVKAIVQTGDIFSTLATLVGSEYRPSRQPYSLLPEDLARESREFAVAEYLAPQLHSFGREGIEYDSYFTRKLRALRTAEHKYIWSSDGHHELYDVQCDPGETQNLLSANPQLAASLAKKLDEWLAELKRDRPDSVVVGNKGEETDMAEEILSRLRALDYI